MVLAPPSPFAPRWSRVWWQNQAQASAPAVLSLIVATGVFVIGWHGVDQAAQTYRVVQYKAHGLMLWDSGWYGGNFPLSYSVLFPPLAGFVGLDVAAVGSAVLATWSFDRVVRSYFGARPIGTYYFAISSLLPVAIGQWTFLSGEAVGLAALVALQRGRRPLAIALAIASGLFSPLAAAFLAMACLAWAAHAAGRRVWMIATAAACIGLIALSGILFPGTGPFPYVWTGFVPTELLCLTTLTPLVKTTPAVRLGALFYAAASLFSFLVPNSLGGNASRLAASVGIPLLACFVTAPGPALERLTHARFTRWAARGANLHLSNGWRLAAVGLIVPFAVWQWAPSRLLVTASADAENQATFYTPLLNELKTVSASPIRLEIPPTLEHWEAAFVAPQVPLARGWERQLDIGDNPIFYVPGDLTVTSYQQWLASEGVSFVALPNAPLDYAAKGEASLLRSGQVTDLKKVWSNPNWTLWSVIGSPGLVSGPATLTSLEPDHLTLAVNGPGTITIRVRFTKFWSITTGAACVSRGGPAGLPTKAADGTIQAPTTNWTDVEALGAGQVEISATVVHPAPLPICPSS